MKKKKKKICRPSAVVGARRQTVPWDVGWKKKKLELCPVPKDDVNISIRMR